jgi:predicted metal-dependent hydrolase
MSAELFPEQLSLFWRSLSSTPAPAAKTQTEHVIQLGHAIVPYRLRRAPRRRLTMTIDAHGLRLGASQSLPQRDIEAFIQQHATWVIDKLAQRAAAPVPRKIVISDGQRLPLLDGEIAVRVLPGHNRVRWIGDTLVLESRPHADHNALARRALQARALSHFAERLSHFAPLVGVTPPELGLSSANTRWGSCSLNSGIRINWRLIHLSPRLGDYVVVHELAHLQEMNHSPRFWRVVENVCPDWKSARGELKAIAPTLPLI